MSRSIKLKIFGKVQGVFFRQSAHMKAEELGITAYANNEPDGTVTIRAEGDEKALEEFIAWCHEGPKEARVKNVVSSL